MKRISQIDPLVAEAMNAAEQRLNALVKPIGSLGRLEEFAIQLSGITGKLYNDLSRKAVVVFAADNGIWEEGITPVPQMVTAMQTMNMARGVTGISVLADFGGADLKLIDIGIKDPVSYGKIENYRIKNGAGNIAKGPAMTREEAEKALITGLDLAAQCKAEGYALLGTGEMGICNTSSSSAVLCALTGVTPEEATGRGAGISDGQLSKKIEAIKSALCVNKPDKQDVTGTLAKVGGLDIAAMAGFFLGAAYERIPVVVDGFISAVAALAAVRLNPAAKAFMFASHKSTEIGYERAIKAAGLEPVFDLRMRLGEGTGCPFAFFCLEASQRILKHMATFDEGNIDGKNLIDIRK